MERNLYVIAHNPHVTTPEPRWSWDRCVTVVWRARSSQKTFIGVDLIGVDLTGCVPYGRVSHGRASHGRGPHGRGPHRCVFYGRVYVSKSKKALRKTSRSPTLQTMIDLSRSELQNTSFYHISLCFCENAAENSAFGSSLAGFRSGAHLRRALERQATLHPVI